VRILLTEDRPSCRKHPLFSGVVERRGRLLKSVTSVEDTYLSSKRTLLLKHTFKVRVITRGYNPAETEYAGSVR
jgi:hypothetical protein